MPDELPRVGEKWAYDHGEEFWVTFVGDEHIHFTTVARGEEVPPYPISSWKQDKDGLWTNLGMDLNATCPVCEEQLKAEGDYLCEDCRYG
jgi:hypothetical protein